MNLQEFFKENPKVALAFPAVWILLICFTQR